MSDKNLAIAYAVRRRAKMFKGGVVQQDTAPEVVEAPEAIEAPDAPAADEPDILKRIMNRHKFASMGNK